MQKLYSRINWENKPSIETPLNEHNLNRMDAALDGLDNRVISQDTTKADKVELNNLVMNWVIDEDTGIITITKKSGEKILFDLNIEKIPVSFSLSDNGILTMTTDDGTQFTANIGAMIPVLTFNDSETIAISVSGVGVNKTYSFSIKNSSVTEEKMQPNYLADIKAEAAKAEASKDEAAESAKQSQSYAVGTGNARPDESLNNAKTYYEKTKEIYDNFNSSGDVTGVKGAAETSYRTGNVNLAPKDIGANPKYRTTFSSGENGSAAGWYRVCSFIPKTVMQFTLNVSRVFYNNPEEALSLKVSVFTGQGTNRVDFEQLNATWRDHIIKKVRVTYANEGEPNHLELYYGGDYKNRVTCDIYNVTNGATAEEGDLLEMLTPAKSSYSGTAWEYTVTKEGSIAKNAVGVLDTHNGNEIKISYAAPSISNFDWVGVWDGYELKTGSPANVVKNGNGLTKNVGEINEGVSNVNIRWFTIAPLVTGMGYEHDFGGTMASVICCINGDVNATDLYITSWKNTTRTRVLFNFSNSHGDRIRITGLLLYTP